MSKLPAALPADIAELLGDADRMLAGSTARIGAASPSKAPYDAVAALGRALGLYADAFATGRDRFCASVGQRQPPGAQASRPDPAAVPAWLAALGTRLCLEYNRAAMLKLETGFEAAAAGAVVGAARATQAEQPPPQAGLDSPFARTLPSFSASAYEQASRTNPQMLTPWAMAGESAGEYAAEEHTLDDALVAAGRATKDIARRIKLLGKAEALTREGPRQVVPDTDCRKIRATTFNNLAILHRTAKRPHMALRCLVRAAELEATILGADHATTHLNMAAVLSTLDRHRDALGHANIAIRLLLKKLSADADAPPAARKTAESLLAVAHYNAAVEREHLRHRASSIVSYRAALAVAKRQLPKDHPVVSSIASSIADCSTGNVDGYKLPRPPGSPRGKFSRTGPRTDKIGLGQLGLGTDAPKADHGAPGSQSPMAGVTRIKRFASLEEEVVSVFKEAMRSKRIVNGEKIETVEDIFMAIDIDGGGTVSGSEFQDGLKRLSIIISDKACKKMVNDIDTDGNGEINFAEFVAHMNKKFEKRKAATHSSGVASRMVVSKKAQRRAQKQKKLDALRRASPTTAGSKSQDQIYGVADDARVEPAPQIKLGDSAPTGDTVAAEKAAAPEEATSTITRKARDLSPEEFDKASHRLFTEFDTSGDGHIKLDELTEMLADLPSRVNIDGFEPFDESDVQRVMEAFDEDGNGEIEEGEWSEWIKGGLKRSDEARAEFAETSPLAKKLSLFLDALEVLLVEFDQSK